MGFASVWECRGMAPGISVFLFGLLILEKLLKEKRGLGDCPQGVDFFLNLNKKVSMSPF